MGGREDPGPGLFFKCVCVWGGTPSPQKPAFPASLIWQSKQARGMCITFAVSLKVSASLRLPQAAFWGHSDAGISAGVQGARWCARLTKTQPTKAAKQKHPGQGRGLRGGRAGGSRLGSACHTAARELPAASRLASGRGVPCPGLSPRPFLAKEERGPPDWLRPELPQFGLHP